MPPPPYEYDVCLSFAGEDRPYIEEVANQLKCAGVRVFYDGHELVETWGKDLYQHFSDVYRKHARYCVVFISAAYAAKLWPRLELQSAQARAFGENREYILPARFDSTEIPGVLPTVAYIDISKMCPEKFTELVVAKLGLETTFAPEAQPVASAPPKPLPTPHVLSGQPEVTDIRSRISEPLDACEKYRDTVENLAYSGRWAYTTGVAYPSELLAADEALLNTLRAFVRDLRTAVDEIDAQDKKRREEPPGFLGLASSHLGDIRKALLQAAAETEKLKDMRQLMRTQVDRNRIAESQLYQAAVSALNKIVDEVEKAEEKREIDLSFFQMFVDQARRSS